MEKPAAKPVKRDVHGWVILDKPLGLTSTRAVSRVKHIFNAKKAGHAGTLDPLATGVLAIALGEATKTVPFVMDARKTYTFTLAWGASTNTDDAEGDIVEVSEYRPTIEEIDAILPKFTGTIMQRPPDYSALKIDGKRAYSLARAGKKISLDPRPVEIHSFTRLECPDSDSASFEVSCAKGTYIRALARDMAEQLGTKGHITALRRTRIGVLNEEHMISLDKLEALRHIGARQETLLQALLSFETVLDDIPVQAVDRQEAAQLKNGHAVFLGDRNARQQQGIIYVSSDGCPVAIAELRNGSLYPKRVFNFPASTGEEKLLKNGVTDVD